MYIISRGLAMEDPQLAKTASAYTTRLDRTLKALQDRVKEQEALLEELRVSTTPIDTEPSADLRAQLKQLRTLKGTYQSLTPSEPWLPHRDSQLPGLLALRVTDKTVKETQEAIASTEAELAATTKRLEKEKADLNDAKLMQTEMEARIVSLRGDIQARTQKSPGQIAKDMIRELKNKKAYYDSETEKLVKAFNAFIDDHLAPMLAVEELGGPIVGDLVDVDEEMLGSGFSAKGKLKRGKLGDDKRQKRIDQIWGIQPVEEEPWDEKRAAGAEMRELTELLLNSLVDADGNGPGVYIELPRESAAARFLVRSKVAQFHPKDARKLRLVDFGGEIDD